MKKLLLNSDGFSPVILLAVIVFVGVTGVLAYRYLDTYYSQSPALSSQGQGASAEKINSKADIQKASDSLDQTDVDKSLDSSQLDQDVNDLL